LKIRPWLIYAIITTTFWGVWGALIELPEKAGFPATLGYVVWALTMIPPALVALKIINWKLEKDKKSRRTIDFISGVKNRTCIFSFPIYFTLTGHYNNSLIYIPERTRI
jgi:hypothetical protein